MAAFLIFMAVVIVAILWISDGPGSNRW
jgi:hypothetical protein